MDTAQATAPRQLISSANRFCKRVLFLERSVADRVRLPWVFICKQRLLFSEYMEHRQLLKKNLVLTLSYALQPDATDMWKPDRNACQQNSVDEVKSTSCPTLSECYYLTVLKHPCAGTAMNPVHKQLCTASAKRHGFCWSLCVVRELASAAALISHRNGF